MEVSIWVGKAQASGRGRADRGRALGRVVHEGTLSGKLVWK